MLGPTEVNVRLQMFSSVVSQPMDLQVSHHIVSVKSSPLLHHSTNWDLFIYGDDTLTRCRVTMRTEQLTKCFELVQKLRTRLGL